MQRNTTYAASLLTIALLFFPLSAQSQFTSGKLLERINSGGYSYLRIESNNETFWLAAPLTDIKEGETIRFTKGMLMENFTSPSLNRTFPQIYFTGSVLSGDQQPRSSFNHSKKPSKDQPTVTADMIQNVHPLSSGISIQDLYTKKGELAGTKVKIRGIVTKYNADIMGKNWIHLRDASTGANGDDLVVTTSERFTVGEVVTLEGIVSLDQNFGFGYSYALLLTKAVRVSKL